MKKIYITRFIFWDGTKEDEAFDTKAEANHRKVIWKSGGYNVVVKKRSRLTFGKAQ